MGADGAIGVTDSKVVGNAVRQTGGPDGNSRGAGVFTRTPVQITDSTIARNTGEEAAGVGVDALDGALTLEGSTVSGNRAKRGGGIHFDSDTDDSIVNSTLSGDEARRGAPST
jgi:hypothetical protein